MSKVFSRPTRKKKYTNDVLIINKSEINNNNTLISLRKVATTSSRLA